MARQRDHSTELVETPESVAVAPQGRPPDPATDQAGFLTWHGWEPDDEGLWPDPLGQGGEPEQVQNGTIKDEQGNPKPLMQTRLPLAPWRYPIAEAVQLQKLRNGGSLW